MSAPVRPPKSTDCPVDTAFRSRVAIRPASGHLVVPALEPGPIAPGVNCNRKHLPDCRRHTRAGGYPVRREFSIPSLASRNTGPSAFADDDERRHSRDTMRPSFANSFHPQKTRAQGRPGARCTRGLMCKDIQKSAHEHTGSAEAFRPSLRNGFTIYFVLSPARPGLFATVAPNTLASQELDTSHWGVRTTRLRVRITRCSSKAHPRPPHPAPRP
jgi:hypothetical protein